MEIDGNRRETALNARLPGSNPAYVLATQPLRGQRLQVNAKDVPSSLPDVARSAFTEPFERTFRGVSWRIWTKMACGALEIT